MQDTSPSPLSSSKSRDQGWRLGKEISLVHILSFASMATASIWYIAELKGELQLMRSVQQNLTERIERSEAASDRAIVRIENTVLRIEQRLNAVGEQKYGIR